MCCQGYRLSVKLPGGLVGAEFFIQSSEKPFEGQDGSFKFVITFEDGVSWRMSSSSAIPATPIRGFVMAPKTISSRVGSSKLFDDAKERQ